MIYENELAFLGGTYISLPLSYTCTSCVQIWYFVFAAGWEHISQFIAQSTRARDPFTKEDCIAKYQQLHAAPAGPGKKIGAPVAAVAPLESSANPAPDRPARREPRVGLIAKLDADVLLGGGVGAFWGENWDFRRFEALDFDECICVLEPKYIETSMGLT